MSLITRTAKGTKLTITDMDGNLTYLEELAQTAVQGPIGPAGPQGSAGESVTILGSYADLAAFGAGAGASPGLHIGDAWIILTDGSLYSWNGTIWFDAGDIKGPEGAQGPIGAQGPAGPTPPVKNEFYVAADATGTMTGSRTYPFSTIASAISAAIGAGYDDTNPAFIVLLTNITEDVNLTNGGIWLTTSYGTGTHGAIILTGTITVNGASASSVVNHFSISNLRLVAPSGEHGIEFTGTNPQRLFLKDLWIDANGTKTGVYADNSGTGSVCHMNTGHLAHSGTGDVYCIDVLDGTVTLTDIETSGNVQVVAVRTGATLTLDSSEIDANGGAALELYGGSAIVTRSLITNTKVGGNGIALNTAGSVLTIGDCLFNIDTISGAGKAVYGVAGTFLFYQYLSFYPGSNTKKTAAPTLTATALATAFT